MYIPEKWLHIGTNRLTVKSFTPIKNDPVVPKPHGGIWASSLLFHQDYYSHWQEFSINTFGKRKKDKQGVIFSLKRNARIYVIDTQEDLMNLVKEVGIAKSPIPYLNTVLVDFERAQQFYDVIYLTRKGEVETKRPLVHREYNLCGWDVESCLIMNPYVIGRQLPVTL